MIALLLAAAFLPLGSSNLCPDPIRMRLTQDNLVLRPVGPVGLTCVITGVASHELEFHQWTIDDISAPLYRYSEIYKLDGILPEHARWVNEVNNKFLPDGIHSEITLTLNVANRYTFGCEFRMKPGIFCRRTIAVTFQDPKVSLAFDKIPTDGGNSLNVVVVDADCGIDVAASTPHFNMTYEGDQPGNFQILHQESDSVDYGYFHHGSYHTTVIVPYNGEVVCEVKDALGVYRETQTVNATDPLRPMTKDSHCVEIIVAVAVAAIFLIPLITIVFIYLVFRWRKKRFEVLHDYQMVPINQPIKEDKIFERYFSNKWVWMKIEELSDNPVLYEGSGPSTSDVQQELDVYDDSWFLAALNSLCLAFEKGHWQQFHKIFGKAQDLKGSQIPIKLWRYGEWKTVYVTPTLPTTDEKLCFMHSSNNNVFWSALLQKAYAQEYITHKGLYDERDIHILEDLTGGVVRNYKKSDYQEENRTLYTALNLFNKTAISLTWKNKRVVNDGVVFYSVHEIHEKHGEVLYRDFLPADGASHVSSNSFHMAEGPVTLRTVQSDEFVYLPDEYNLLYKETNSGTYTLLQSFSGKWTHSGSGNNYHRDHYWKNPQYFVRSESPADRGEFVQLGLAVMQKETADKNIPTKALPRSLKIGLNGFRIANDEFSPMHAMTRMTQDIRFSWDIKPRVSREVCGWWTIPVHDELIFVPTVEGGKMPADFIFRVFTDKPHLTRVEQLPHHPDLGKNVASAGI